MTGRRLRILFIQQVACRGGSGTMLCNILAALRSTEFDPIVLCPSGDLVPAFRALGAEVIESQTAIPQLSHYTGLSYFAADPRFLREVWSVWRNATALASSLRRLAPDIVHLNALTLAPYAKKLRETGARVVCLVQETFADGAIGCRTKWLRRVLSRDVDGVVFISEADRERAECRAPLVEVIPNWVDVSRFEPRESRAEARKSLGLDPEDRAILMMGGLSELKGSHVAIEAMRLVKEENRWVLLVAGEGRTPPPRGFLASARSALGLGPRAYERRLLASIDSAEMKGRVRLVGVRADVERLYGAADVVVFPATRPHQARPVIEAGAAGRPVVVSRFEGRKDLVEDGVSGICVKANDPADLARALDGLAAEPERARRLGEANRAASALHHDALTNGPRYVEFLRHVAQAPLARRS